MVFGLHVWDSEDFYFVEPLVKFRFLSTGKSKYATYFHL